MCRSLIPRLLGRPGSGPSSGVCSSSEQASELEGLAEALSEESLNLLPPFTEEGEGDGQGVPPSPSDTV